jgi:uncharacterized membrane protein YfcA
MIEAVTLFLVAIGAVTVAIASMLRMAWLAILVPILIAAAAAYGLFALRRRRPRPVAGPKDREAMPPEGSSRRAA